MVVDGRGS